MLKKLAVVGSVVAVAGLGVGGVAAAWTGAPAAQAGTPMVQAGVPSAVGAVVDAATSTTVTATTAASKTTKPAKTTDKAKKHGKRAGLAKRLLQVSHAQWVSKDAKTGTFVTHDAVRGAVTAAATGSITIKATDGTSETFVVTGSTKVRVAGATGTMGQVKVGDQVAVLGTGSGPMTATRVVAHAPGVKKKSTGTAPTTTAAPTS